jgi:hypothetical protein
MVSGLVRTRNVAISRNDHYHEEKKKRKKQHKKKEEEDQQTAGKNSSSAPHTTNTGQHPSPSYNHQEFVNSIMDACSNLCFPKYSDDDNHKEGGNNGAGWKVDLDHYDLELVLIITTSVTVGIGISMYPYSCRGSGGKRLTVLS